MVAKSARFLAPIALVAVAVGVYLLVHSTLRPSTTTTTSSTAATFSTRRPARHHHAPKYYVVKSGDTLSAIADRTGVPASRIAALNPAISAEPNSLQTGQRLRLRR